MTRYGGLAIVVLSGLLVGCQPKPPEAPPQAPALGYDEIRTELMSANPGAVVGQVGGTYVQYHLVLINNVEPGRLQLGDPVSFLDDRLNTLTIGKVTKIMPDGNIIVRIEPPAAGGRLPGVGDVAVHIAPGAVLNTTPPPPASSTESGPTTMPALPAEMTNPTPAATEPTSQPAEMSPATAAAAPESAPATAPEAPPATAMPPTPPAAPPATQPELNK
ncbi:MAG TPA: hypothetical protein VHY37_04525 [Tepidisphaeraceae bacterium]|nr:hypothetical protein [Tepidisphaeraceae bacterium]